MNVDGRDDAQRAHDDTTAAVEHEALAALERLEAYLPAGVASAVRRRLTDEAIRRSIGRERAPYGWESITPAERRVIDLVAEGLSNHEIAQELYLSRYTVETHLKHVFAKVAVRSRAELAAITVRRRTLAAPSSGTRTVAIA